MQPLSIQILKIESHVPWASGLVKNCTDRVVDVRYIRVKKFQLMALLSISESLCDVYSNMFHENHPEGDKNK